MTAHELARKLLEMHDLTVLINSAEDEYGDHRITSVFEKISDCPQFDGEFLNENFVKPLPGELVILIS